MIKALRERCPAGTKLLAFKVDHSEGYKHLTTSLNLSPMLCFSHRGTVYRNLVMPFGYRPAAGFYQRFTSALQWCVRQEISASGPTDYEALTLLDDSLYVAAEADVYDVKAVVTQIHDEFNVKRNETKDRKEGTPASVFEWYGIIFDLEADTLSLPEAKRLKYLLFVLNALDSEALDRKTIEKLIGCLVWASVVVVPGRAFLFNLRAILRSKGFHRLPLSPEARAELRTWKGMLSGPPQQRPALTTSLHDKQRITIGQDAATSTGAGGALLLGNSLYVWSFRFPESIKTDDFLRQIRAMEFWAITTSVLAFRSHLVSKHIDVRTDSKSSDWVIKKLSSRKDIVTAHFLQRLMQSVARLNASIASTHVAGKLNVIPDIASRQGIPAVRSLIAAHAPHVQVIEVPVPRDAILLLREGLALKPDPSATAQDSK